MAKALGIVGVFFKSKDPKALCEWYAQHLGFTVDKWGGVKFGKRAGYEDIPGFRSVAMGGLGQLGLMAQDGLRQAFESIEQGP